MPSNTVYLDDIIVTGSTKAEHILNLRQAFERFRQFGVLLKLEKCKFFEPEVPYLGFIATKDGPRQDESRLEAVRQEPRPQNLQ